MKLKASLICAISALGLSACAPDTTEVLSGRATAEPMLEYSISKYEEPYGIGEIDATHVLEYETKQLSSEAGRIRLIGIPDEVWEEYSNLIDVACERDGKRYRAMEYLADVHNREATVYFVCA